MLTSTLVVLTPAVCALTGHWVSPKKGALAKASPDLQFKVVNVFLYNFASGLKVQARVQTVAWECSSSLSEPTLTVISHVHHPNSVLPEVGLVYDIKTIYPKVNLDSVCLPVKVIYTNPTKYPTVYTELKSSVLYPQTHSLQARGCTKDDLHELLADAPDPVRGVSVRSVEGTIAAIVPHGSGKGANILISLVSGDTVSLTVWLLPAMVCPGGVALSSSVKVFSPVVHQGRDANLYLKTTIATIVTTDPDTFSDTLRAVIRQPVPTLTLPEAMEQVENDPNPTACQVVTVKGALFDDLTGCEELTKIKCRGCTKLVPDDGSTTLCNYCEAPTRASKNSSLPLFWFLAAFIINGVSYSVRFNSVSGAQLMQTTGSVWSAASREARDHLFNLVSDRLFTLVLKINRYKSVAQLMCTGATLEPLEVIFLHAVLFTRAHFCPLIQLTSVLLHTIFFFTYPSLITPLYAPMFVFSLAFTYYTLLFDRKEGKYHTGIEPAKRSTSYMAL